MHIRDGVRRSMARALARPAGWNRVVPRES